MMRSLPWSLLMLVCLFVADARSNSYAAPGVRIDHVRLDAALETALKPGATAWVAIRQVIDPGWHTYWRNPGDAGLATTLTWKLPKDVTAGRPLWPAPERFVSGPVVDYGYRDEAILLVPLTMGASGKPAMAHVQVSLLECSQMCIPEQASLTIDLRQASGARTIFARAGAALPRAFGGIARAGVTATALTVSLEDPAFAKLRPESIRIFPATMGAVNNDAPATVRLNGNTLIWTAARSPHPKPLDSFDFVVEAPDLGAVAVTARIPPP